MHPRYQEWIRYVFDHPVTDPQWYFDIDASEFDTSDADSAILIKETFECAENDLRDFSDAQVNQGIWFLVSPSGSSYIFALRDGDIPTNAKVTGIHSIYCLYRGLFAKRCTEALGHTDEAGSSDLNPICYMFWDVCPLSYLEGVKEKPVLEDAVFLVLQNILTIRHRACIEAALHGLGEMAYTYKDRVEAIIKAFLKTTKIDDTLRIYAESAMKGAIQ